MKNAWIQLILCSAAVVFLSSLLYFHIRYNVVFERNLPEEHGLTLQVLAREKTELRNDGLYFGAADDVVIRFEKRGKRKLHLGNPDDAFIYHNQSEKLNGGGE